MQWEYWRRHRVRCAICCVTIGLRLVRVWREVRGRIVEWIITFRGRKWIRRRWHISFSLAGRSACRLAWWTRGALSDTSDRHVREVQTWISTTLLGTLCLPLIGPTLDALLSLLPLPVQTRVSNAIFLAPFTGASVVAAFASSRTIGTLKRDKQA